MNTTQGGRLAKRYKGCLNEYSNTRTIIPAIGTAQMMPRHLLTTAERRFRVTSFMPT